jgi:dinuclear metal center YbgI/SA1388 family protein
VAGVKTVGELVEALALRAPFSTAAGFDPVGLQLGDPGAPARRVAVCHEVTEAVVEAVLEEPVDLLVTYHPLLFRPTTRLVAGRDAGGRAWRLARAGTALAVVHTSFDVAHGGAADALADALGIGERRGFAPLFGADSVKIATFLPADAADRVLEAVAAAGAGRIGNYTHCSFRSAGVGSFFASEATAPVVGARGALNREPEVRIEFVAPRARESAVLAALLAAHPYEEPAYDVYDRRGDARMLGRVGRLEQSASLADFAAGVGAALAVATPRAAGERARPIERVAVIPGSGADFFEAAADAGADAVVTGDVTHHRARAALERGLAVIDPGHAATERPGVRRLRDWVGELGAPVRDLLALDPDPWTGARG